MGCIYLGYGQHIAYEYAKKGARLSLVARRELQLQQVADRCMTKGAADVKVIPGDVTQEQQCKRFVDETIAKYGRRKILYSGIPFNLITLSSTK